MASTVPSGHSKEPPAGFPEQPSTFQKIPSKSHSNSVFKTLIVLVLLLVIGFFPSQAPDFFSRTISAQFWEVIHLLFIGIAVSYGLFGRRKSSQIFEISRIDNDLSGISHLSSIFEDGFGSTCNGTDGRERDSTQRYNASCCSCQCFGGSVLGQSGCVVHGGSIGAEVRSFGSNNASGYIEKNAKKNRTWSSKYSKGESLVAVANVESLDSKPLNLPVRSLRTSFADSVKVGDKGKNNNETTKIRGVVPKNLEKRFDESDELSPRSCRMGNEEKREDEERNDIKPRVHCSPHTAWDFEFEHIKSCPSNKVLKFSTSSDLETSRVRGAEGENVTSASRPKIAPLTDVGNGSYEEDKDVGKGKRPIEPLESGKKPLALVKAKSVRTIKPRRYVVTTRKAESPLVNISEAENLVVNHPNEEVDRQFSLPKPKPSLPDFFVEEKEERSVEKNIAKDSEEGRDSELKESSDEEEDAKTNIDYDLGSEVDRKAGEFIAKFREQIRRQKALSSAERCSREFL